jgi:hypothetical protein
MTIMRTCKWLIKTFTIRPVSDFCSRERLTRMMESTTNINKAKIGPATRSAVVGGHSVSRN